MDHLHDTHMLIAYSFAYLVSKAKTRAQNMLCRAANSFSANNDFSQESHALPLLDCCAELGKSYDLTDKSQEPSKTAHLRLSMNNAGMVQCCQQPYLLKDTLTYFYAL